jgi:hypothetical protein
LDPSNVFHFFFSLFIPLGWAVILRPFSRKIFRGWPSFFIFILAISFVSICGKELMDRRISLNDLAADILGFFFGLMILSLSFQRMGRKLDRTKEKIVVDYTISLRSTLALIERIERRSSEFYDTASIQISENKTSEICKLLSKDAQKRANNIGYMLSGWSRKPEPLHLASAIEKAFSSDQIFALDFSRVKNAKDALEIALDHERKKFALFSKFESAFHEEWKVIRLEMVLENLNLQVTKLEQLLAEIRQ